VLSVISTLEESFYLWVRNFRFLAVVSILTATPDAFSRYFDDYDLQYHAMGPTTAWGMVIVLGMLFNAIGSAAILGWLRRESPEEKAWVVACRSIDRNMWTLFRKGLLLAGMGILMTIPLLALTAILPLKIMIVLSTSLYVIFLKYALADPVIVVENLDAIDALKRSWEMTRNHFGYVLGCYLLLAAGDEFLQWAFTPPTDGPSYVWDWAWPVAQYGLALYNCAWIVLSWQMYLRIKEADATNEIVAPIESTSGP
jgi:hypothetical protein